MSDNSAAEMIKRTAGLPAVIGESLGSFGGFSNEH